MLEKFECESKTTKELTNKSIGTLASSACVHFLPVAGMFSSSVDILAGRVALQGVKSHEVLFSDGSQ